MSVLTLKPVTPTEEGFRAEGTLDAGGKHVLSLQVYYKPRTDEPVSITGAEAGFQGAVRIESPKHGLVNGDFVLVEDVRGTVEANGDWTVRRITDDKFDLKGSTFRNAYTSSGTWLLGRVQEKGVLVAGDPPSANWSVDVRAERNFKYDVHATLFWAGSPPVIRTQTESVDLSGRE